MQKKYLIAATAFTLLWSAGCSVKGATIVEEQKVIKTYPFSEPDPVPILIRSSLWGPGSRLYPYFFFSGFSHTGIEKSWKVVRMENPYIEVFVLPEVGGKVWGAIEKSTKKEFIYTNHVLKFREIALRGPWTSGGIEFNSGIIGHTPSCAAPVDYLVRENPDGSVSCIVGTMDLPSRTRWSVNITLPKDKAFFETHTLLHNPSALEQPYYCWLNAAGKVGNDLQYIYPGNFHAPHGYSSQPESWPVDKKGRDLSWYKNNNFGSSKAYFIIGEYEHFKGCYWHDSEFGFGHWALYDDVPGKKIFLWSLSREGGIWEELLTDDDGQYYEPQAGRLYNQNDHKFFSPYSVDMWREVWFPYKQIGPMVKATPYGALNVTRTDDSVTLNICPLQKLNDELVVIADGNEVYREQLVLEPMEIYRKNLAMRVDQGKLRVSVSKKICYSDDPQANILHRPINFHHFDEGTTEGLYLAAERYEKQRNYHTALTKYLGCLEQEPLHTRALTRVAELYCRRGEYEKALTYAHKALENVMYDADANYIYGVICRRLGNLVDAKETLGWAARSMKYRSGAYCQMAEIFLLEQNFELALEFAQRSLDFNKYNINAYQVLATTYRKREEGEQARQVLKQLLEIDPLNHLARFELYLLEPNQKNLNNFQSMIRNELAHENYIEMALYYVKLGLNADAVQLLKYAPEYPTIYYWLAYLLKDKAPAESKMYLDKAYKLSAKLVFPFREESIPVLRWACETLPTDWKAKYYLGLIYWGKERIQQAREMLDDCGEPNFAPFYISRGYLHKESEPRKTLADLEKAVNVDSADWRNWHHLISFYNEQKAYDKSLTLSQKAVGIFPDEVVIKIDLVRVLMGVSHYAKALAILEKTEVLPYEGAYGVHRLFVRCQIHLALENMKKGDYAKAIGYIENSKAYPEHLGTGRPYEPDFSLQGRLEAICRDKMEAEDKNAAKFQMAPELLELIEAMNNKK